MPAQPPLPLPAKITFQCEFCETYWLLCTGQQSSIYTLSTSLSLWHDLPPLHPVCEKLQSPQALALWLSQHRHILPSSPIGPRFIRYNKQTKNVWRLNLRVYAHSPYSRSFMIMLIQTSTSWRMSEVSDQRHRHRSPSGSDWDLASGHCVCPTLGEEVSILPDTVRRGMWIGRREFCEWEGWVPGCEVLDFFIIIIGSASHTETGVVW